jgi:hypothetical protein
MVHARDDADLVEHALEERRLVHESVSPTSPDGWR